jgi:hypothetical protein
MNAASGGSSIEILYISSNATSISCFHTLSFIKVLLRNNGLA